MSKLFNISILVDADNIVDKLNSGQLKPGT